MKGTFDIRKGNEWKEDIVNHKMIVKNIGKPFSKQTFSKMVINLMIINICDNRILYFIWLKYSILYFYKINNVNLIIDLNNNGI